MYLERLFLNVWRVEASLICKGIVFQIIAPEYWRLRLNNSFLCLGIHIFCASIDRKPYDEDD